MSSELEKSANRLHHLSMLYVGSVVELAKGEPVGLLPHNYPGLKDVRDLIDQVLYCRAEVNALTAMLIESKLVSMERAEEIMAENYNWFADQKIKLWPGYKITDYGIQINTDAATAPPEQKN